MPRTDTPLQFVKGVGPRRASALSRAGLNTVEDLLYLFPFRYEDRRRFARLADLVREPGEGTVLVRVGAVSVWTRNRFSIVKTKVTDGTATLTAVWFNQPWLKKLLEGREAVLFGRVIRNKRGEMVLESPEWEVAEEDDASAAGIHTGRIVPIYRKTGEVNSRGLRALVHHAFEALAPDELTPIVPPEMLERHGLLDRLTALRDTHFPPPDTSIADLERRHTLPQRSLAFEEIFLLQLALALRRGRIESQGRGHRYEITDALRTRLARLLPFKLTEAQKRVLREIGSDLRSERPMNRLLQGDVGSGKTIVALLTLLVAVENGFQAALLVPTEILAEQHFRNVCRMLDEGGIDCRVALLTGSQKAAPRRRALEDIRSGLGKIAIGTHALLEEGVDFRRLGIVVIDEQHRFGVMQRATMAGKSTQPDVLVMTATPIPRSLSLTFYGDLDLSVIDEMPPGRTPVKTVVRGEGDRAKVYEGVRREVEEGRQVYFVLPLVEETERSDLKAATSFAEELRRRDFSDLRVGLLHGRMKGADKDAAMQAFSRGEIDILVSTTVIEVGVDVANATVMIVEHAERFGLSQLHQLRGRVGRGGARSYCVLMVGEEGFGREARQRLHIMEQTNDGFRIAESDLRLRGPGAVFGTQQHGLGDLEFLAVILEDTQLVDTARDEARRLVASGPGGRTRAMALLESLGERWRGRLDLARVG
jgi:ATP-dependent DNA helicase RecG